MAYTTDTALLTAVNDALQAIAEGRVSRYQINGQSAERIPVSELLQMRRELKADIAAEDDSVFSVGEIRGAV